jgi:DNA invertase Pin-like site-specific DNA recombinase
LNIEIHLVKQGQVISKEAKSQAKLIHGIEVVLARNYIENLREEVKKGMREKAAQGIYPGRAAFGYRNNRAERTIEVHPGNASTVLRIFELYASREYSLLQLRRAVRDCGWSGSDAPGSGHPVPRGNLFSFAGRALGAGWCAR